MTEVLGDRPDPLRIRAGLTPLAACGFVIIMVGSTTQIKGEFEMTKSNIEQYGAELLPSRPIMTYALWSVQVLLALIFLFAGGMKLVLPLEEMTKQMPLPLPGLFLRFIGVTEVLGAIGLILPGLLRIRAGLTPLAACGLAIIMVGATVYTLAGGGGAAALIPLVVGLLSTFVAFGRWSCFAAGPSSCCAAETKGVRQDGKNDDQSQDN